MQELLVLGLVPGTNIQITFAIWLAFICSVVSIVVVTIIKRRHVIRNLVVTFALMYLCNNRVVYGHNTLSIQL
jgi:hypothetical protein